MTWKPPWWPRWPAVAPTLVGSEAIIPCPPQRPAPREQGETHGGACGVSKNLKKVKITYVVHLYIEA